MRSHAGRPAAGDRIRTGNINAGAGSRITGTPGSVNLMMWIVDVANFPMQGAAAGLPVCPAVPVAALGSANNPAAAMSEQAI